MVQSVRGLSGLRAARYELQIPSSQIFTVEAFAADPTQATASSADVRSLARANPTNALSWTSAFGPERTF
jgi:hypothetical protein